ncbi:MAG: carbohydrate porin [Rickettsiales bacterium]
MKLLVFFLSLMLPFAALANEEPFGDRLLGDAYGLNSYLAKSGIEATLDYQGNIWFAEGSSRYVDLVQLRTTFNNEKLLGLKGNTVSIAAIATNGASINNASIDSLQGVDNIETVSGGIRLYEAWFEQSIAELNLSILIGLRDLNVEFAATPMSANFTVPTFQIGQAFAQSGTNGPSVYPTTSLAARVKYNPTENTFVSVGVFDGVPGDPARTKGSAIRFGKDDGLLLVGEAGFTPTAESNEDEWDKISVGGWRYTSDQPDLASGLGKHQEGLYQSN